MTDSSSRTDFIKAFSELCGLDPDELIELFIDLDNVNGITSRCDGNDLYFSFVLEDIAHPLITFSIDGSHASAYICPIRLTSFLKEHGVFPFEAEGFFNDYRQFLLNPSKSTSYPYGEKFYVDISEVVECEMEFVVAVQKLMDTIYIV